MSSELPDHIRSYLEGSVFNNDEVMALPAHVMEIMREQEAEVLPDYVIPEYAKAYDRQHVFKGGLPFSEKLAENVDDAMTRVMKKGKASCIVIDGGVGEGKTTLGDEIGSYAQRAPLDLEKQMAMGGGQFMKKAEECYQAGLHVLVYDEAGDFNRRGALKQFNAMLNRFFETYRAYKILVIICVPNFTVLDGQLFRNKIPRLLLHLNGRNESYGNFRGFSLYRMFWLMEHMKKQVVPERAFSKTEPNFYGHFKDLPSDRAGQLAAMSTKNKLSVLQKSRVQLEGFVSVQDIVKATGRTQGWVTGKLRELNIEKVEKIGQRHYYEKNVIKTLDRMKVRK